MSAFLWMNPPVRGTTALPPASERPHDVTAEVSPHPNPLPAGEGTGKAPDTGGNRRCQAHAGWPISGFEMPVSSRYHLLCGMLRPDAATSSAALSGSLDSIRRQLFDKLLGNKKPSRKGAKAQREGQRRRVFPSLRLRVFA